MTPCLASGMVYGDVPLKRVTFLKQALKTGYDFELEKTLNTGQVLDFVGIKSLKRAENLKTLIMGTIFSQTDP